jgi:uncharacterized protein DUF6448
MKNIHFTSISICLLVLLTLLTQTAKAHCDTYGGPVVNAARLALETGNVNYVLVWVKKKDENEINEAFKKTLKVRKLGPEAKELADKSFFETLVRIHRAGEGEPYTGLKPADTDLGPAIPTADRATQSGNIDPVRTLLIDEVRKALQTHFSELMELSKYDVNDVTKGREYVAAYVEFVHFVERTFESAHNPAHGHYEEMNESGHHAE